MKNSQSELVWQGNTHMGDEPGIFGNASYSGLSYELPITIGSFDGKDEKQVKLILESKYVKTFKPYNGHKITVFEYLPDPSPTNPYAWKQTIIAQDFLKDSNKPKDILFNIKGKTAYISCRIEIDTTVKPGLYNDFLIKQLSFYSENYYYYASLGFR
ncbi:MAG: hypothetical protein AAF611_18730 [Bacteroidota bacterium]